MHEGTSSCRSLPSADQAKYLLIRRRHVLLSEPLAFFNNMDIQKLIFSKRTVTILQICTNFPWPGYMNVSVPSSIHYTGRSVPCLRTQSAGLYTLHSGDIRMLQESFIQSAVSLDREGRCPGLHWVFENNPVRSSCKNPNSVIILNSPEPTANSAFTGVFIRPTSGKPLHTSGSRIV